MEAACLYVSCPNIIYGYSIINDKITYRGESGRIKNKRIKNKVCLKNKYLVTGNLVTLNNFVGSTEIDRESFLNKVHINTSTIADIYDEYYNIFPQTAYDIIDGEIIQFSGSKLLERGEIMKDQISTKKFLLVNKIYTTSIRLLLSVIILFATLAIFNFSFFPRSAVIAGLFMLLTGLFCLYIDKIGWRKKYKCSLQ